MGRHSSCPEKQELCGEARRIVLWAGSLIGPREEVGGIGTQLRRAADRLQLHEGVIWRAYQRRAGPEIFPTIWHARNNLIERIASVEAKAISSPWRQADLRLDRRGSSRTQEAPRREAVIQTNRQDNRR